MIAPVPLVLAASLAVSGTSVAAQGPRLDLPQHPVRWSQDVGSARNPARAAVVVTADTYDARPNWALPAAAAAGDLVGKALEEAGGFSNGITRVHRERAIPYYVEDAIVEAGRSLTRPGVLLVYWLGHGCVKSGQQELFTHHSKDVGSDYDQTIGRATIVQWLDKARAEAEGRGVRLTTALIVDACRVETAGPPPKARLIASQTWEVYSTEEGHFVPAGSGDAFPFSHQFAAAMRSHAERNIVVSLVDVFRDCDYETRRAPGGLKPKLIPPNGDLTAAAPALVVPPRVAFTLRVKDALADTAVAGAEVVFNDQKIQLDGPTCQLEGGASRDSLVSRHNLVINCRGYLSRADRVELRREHTGRELTIALLPALCVVTGRIEPRPKGRVRVEASSMEGIRSGFHVAAALTDADGRFELRLPRVTEGSKVRIVAGTKSIADYDIPRTTRLVSVGAHDGISLHEMTLNLGLEAGAALGVEAVMSKPADAPAKDPEFASRIDRIEWGYVLDAVRLENFDLAVERMAQFKGNEPGLDAWRTFVASRWAPVRLREGLKAGKAEGDWSKAEQVVTWLSQPRRVALPNEVEIEELVAEVTREKMPLAARRAYEAGYQARREGRLEDALAGYVAARSGVSAHYRAEVEMAIEDVSAQLYERHSSAGSDAELSGDFEKALAAYMRAAEYNKRAEWNVERLLKDPRFVGTATGRAALVRLNRGAEVFGSWNVKIVEASFGTVSGYPRRVEDQTTGIVLILVEPGEFAMGSTADANSRPVHQVRITQPFYLGETEVTVEQWRRFAMANRANRDLARGLADPRTNAPWKKAVAWDESHPVVNVRWSEANAFCRHFGMRLPTEAEWEYACRAGTPGPFWFGSNPSDGQGNGNFFGRDTQRASGLTQGMPWPFEDGHLLTAPVRSFRPNAWGFYDMSGNVAEYCADAYDPQAYSGRRGEVVDPFVQAGPQRVYRGGSWVHVPTAATSASRVGRDPEKGTDYVGFRVARSVGS